MTTKTAKATDTICEALSAHAGITVNDLAERTGLGRSTVGKALSVLESEGRVVRTAGNRDGGKRVADVWSAAAVIEAADEPAAAQAPQKDGAESSNRLSKGALRLLVLEHLQANVGESFTPTAVGKVLQRSSGAVGNALAKLTADGTVAQVGDKPRRYSFINA